MSRSTALVSGSRARDRLAVAAAVAVEAECAHGVPTLLAELRPEPRRRPATLVCSPAARELEGRLRAAGLAASARGRICQLSAADDEQGLGEVGEVLAEAEPAVGVICLPGRLWETALETHEPRGGVLVVDPASERSLAALAVAELHERGLGARVETTAPGPLAARRALAGVRPGGETSERAARIAMAVFGRPPAAHAE